MNFARKLTPSEVGMAKAIQELKRRIAELESGECVWTETRGGVWEEDEVFETSCGQAFCMIEGTPLENGYHFCPNCGKRINEIPLGQTETEQENTR